MAKEFAIVRFVENGVNVHHIVCTSWLKEEENGLISVKLPTGKIENAAKKQTAQKNSWKKKLTTGMWAYGSFDEAYEAYESGSYDEVVVIESQDSGPPQSTESTNKPSSEIDHKPSTSAEQQVTLNSLAGMMNELMIAIKEIKNDTQVIKTKVRTTMQLVNESTFDEDLDCVQKVGDFDFPMGQVTEIERLNAFLGENEDNMKAGIKEFKPFTSHITLFMEHLMSNQLANEYSVKGKITQGFSRRSLLALQNVTKLIEISFKSKEIKWETLMSKIGNFLANRGARFRSTTSNKRRRSDDSSADGGEKGIEPKEIPL